MQIGGEEYLESLRDGRTVYLGGERVDDVTTHPAFRNAARSFAMIYDLKKDPANLELLSYEEGGERHALYWMMPRSREDLVRRLKCHQRLSQDDLDILADNS